MRAYWTDIEKQAKRNEDFRRVLFTGTNMQLVVMSLRPGEEIGAEVHLRGDQFFRIENGKARLELETEKIDLEEDAVFLVPAGTRHNVVNISDHEDLKLYTLYAPPEHRDGTVHRTKVEALKDGAVVL